VLRKNLPCTLNLSEQAYNSIDMKKLHHRMKAMKTVDDQEIDFIFTFIQMLKINLGNSWYSPKHEVPQGGIFSPILFDYATYFLMGDLNTALLSPYQTSCPNHSNFINPKTTGLWVDDLVFVLRSPLLSLKPKLKLLLAILIRTSGDWGLKINFKKSGLMNFFSNMRNYTHLMTRKLF